MTLQSVRQPGSLEPNWYPVRHPLQQVTYLTPAAQAWPLLGFLELKHQPFLQRAGNSPVEWDPMLALQSHQFASQPGEPFAH